MERVLKKGDKGYPSAGKIAWLLWGGEGGFNWAKRKVEEIDNVEELTELSNDEFDILLKNLEGEQINEDEWEVVDEREQGTGDDYEEWADRFIQKRRFCSK